MAEILDVYLHGELCGKVTQEDGGSLQFVYSKNYTGGKTPLSLSMPLQVRSHPNKNIRAFLEGLLPDNENALQALGRRFGESPNNPFALLKHIGRDVAGAIEIYPNGETPSENKDNNKLQKIADVEIEEQLRGKISEYLEGVITVKQGGRISLAGAQPKMALHKSQDGGWYVPTELLPSTHILKPLTEKLKNQDVVEHLTLLAAKNLNLEVCNTELVVFGDLRVLIAERYDRIYSDKTGKYERLHQEDFCQALAVAPRNKYQYLDGGPGVGQISQLISKLPIMKNREEVAKAFFEGLTFNVFAKCPDAHAKNYSLILQNSEVRLAPLYDLTTGVPYEFMDHSAMGVNGKYAFTQISDADLAKEAKRLKIDPKWARDRIEYIQGNVLGAFQSAGDLALEEGLDAERVATVMDAVEGAIR